MVPSINKFIDLPLSISWKVSVNINQQLCINLQTKCIHELHQIFLLLKESNKLLLSNYNFDFIVRAMKIISCLHNLKVYD